MEGVTTALASIATRKAEANSILTELKEKLDVVLMEITAARNNSYLLEHKRNRARDIIARRLWYEHQLELFSDIEMKLKDFIYVNENVNTVNDLNDLFASIQRGISGSVDILQEDVNAGKNDLIGPENANDGPSDGKDGPV